MAGDRALLDVIGYSQSGRYFAFEEFGIQDGSGFAYSNIYVVDLSTDSWVVGTPIREQAESEDISLSQLRAETRQLATDDLAALDIDVPAYFAAMIGDGAPDTDGQSLRFGTPGFSPGDVQSNAELALSSFVTTAASPCEEWFSAPALGYELRLSSAEGERVIHRDGSLPRSRGCPVAYRLHGVVMPMQAATDNAVALISVYPSGFEGPDRRFIAVPLGL